MLPLPHHWKLPSCLLPLLIFPQLDGYLPWLQSPTAARQRAVPTKWLPSASSWCDPIFGRLSCIFSNPLICAFLSNLRSCGRCVRLQVLPDVTSLDHQISPSFPQVFTSQKLSIQGIIVLDLICPGQQPVRVLHRSWSPVSWPSSLLSHHIFYVFLQLDLQCFMSSLQPFRGKIRFLLHQLLYSVHETCSLLYVHVFNPLLPTAGLKFRLAAMYT
jgi:hypothetical protein